MSAGQIRMAKWALGVLWVFATVTLFAPGGSPVVTFGRLVFWVMLVAHAIECPFYWKMMRASGRPLGGQIVQTVLFGVVHYQAMKRELPGS